MSVFFTSAYAVLWLFVLTIPAEKLIMVPGFGSLSKLVGFAAVGVGAFAILMDRRIRVPKGFHTALAVFILWCAFTMRWTVAQDLDVSLGYTYYRLNTYLQLFALVMLIWQFADTEKRVHGLMNAYLIGTMVPAIGTIRNYLSHTESRYYQRYSLDNTEPNDLALVLAISLPLAYYLFLRHRGPKSLLYLLQMAAAAATIFLTASRSGTVAMCVALSMVLWTIRELTPRMRVGVAMAGVLLVAGGVALVPATSWKRLATLGAEVSSGSFNRRSEIWKEGWTGFTKHPLGGVGIGAFPDSVTSLFGHPRTPSEFTPVAHNTYYSILVETGVIGFVLFVVVLAVLVYYLRRMPGLARPAWITTMAVFGLGVMSLSWDDRKPMWFLFALLAAHYGATRATAQTRARTFAPASADWPTRARSYSPAMPPRELVS